jgi:TonB family protein
VTWPRRDLLPPLVCGLAARAAREPASTAIREPGPSAEPSTQPLDRRRFSLVDTKLDLPPLPTTAEESGEVIPIDTPDPRYAEYFAELKRRIDAKWMPPSEASRKGQSGGGEVRFVLLKAGSVRTVEIVRSSGVLVQDVYITNAIRMAQPFPPIPASVADDTLSIKINFNYVLRGAP